MAETVDPAPTAVPALCLIPNFNQTTTTIMSTIDRLNIVLLHAAADQARDPVPPPDVTHFTRDPDDFDEAGPDELRGLHAQHAEEL